MKVVMGTRKLTIQRSRNTPSGRPVTPSMQKKIPIDLLDKLRFSPAAVHVKRGETVRFVVMNSGKLKHEMVLGTDESLKQHAAMMTKFPGMEHDEPHMAHVAPGKQFAMGWQFTEAGTFHFGCLVPGHYEAGMKGTVVVQ